jgi:hypothetical protein
VERLNIDINPSKSGHPGNVHGPSVSCYCYAANPPGCEFEFEWRSVVENVEMVNQASESRNLEQFVSLHRIHYKALEDEYNALRLHFGEVSEVQGGGKELTLGEFLGLRPDITNSLLESAQSLAVRVRLREMRCDLFKHSEST